MPDRTSRRKILVTGATGYIGRRLTSTLRRRSDLDLRLLVRNIHKVQQARAHDLEIIEGDTFDRQALFASLSGVNTAYYLIHSMGAESDFESLDRRSAQNFLEACLRAGVQKIIYLGGLGVKETASAHLASRIETGRILSSGPDRLQTIWIRAGVIIGSGSASFEIIRNLVQKLPVMITPKWVRTRTQPIAVDDVLAYLEAALDLEHDRNLVVDIGAPVMSFKDMLIQAGRVMGLHRYLLPVPVISPRLSSYWLILVTPVNFKIAAALVEGLKSETVQQNDNGQRFFPTIRPMPYAAAVRRALEETENDQVLSRWCDSSAGEVCDIKEGSDPAGAVLRDIRTCGFGDIAPEKVMRAAMRLGGEYGWYAHQPLWRLRGLIDKLAGGYGTGRGRRSHGELRIGDALDFWKVVDIRPGKRLLLLSQMNMPGKAWLEFTIRDHTLVQTAHYLPRGVWGYLYWYAVMPLHRLVFTGLVKKIVKQAGKPSQGT